MLDRARVRAAYDFFGSVRAASRELGVSEGAVRAALADGARDRYVRAPAPSAVDAVEPALRRLLSRFPRITVDAAAREVGWSRSRSVLAERLRELRPEYANLPAVPGVQTGRFPRDSNDLMVV
ncbi:hypothetical protein ATL40_1433 [Serinibacter salmoneus]|uniref:Uncharacterized protein n=1 Tax=Serinibacter salmoneus TaxID=556530 RepID=A0A2A9CZJ5_9MICO|nr:hypothetical protein ATL40_1433 [Serinibacter salmoneus]